MKAFKLAALLAALNTTSVAIPVMGTASLLGSTTVAVACTPGVNCNQPTGVRKGQMIPVHKVEYCFIGPADKEHTIVSCDSEQAVHPSPRGKPVVCFMGSDGKPHWDRQDNVRVGRPFINQRINGIWYINWR